MMPKMGSIRYNFMERSTQRLLSQKEGYDSDSEGWDWKRCGCFPRIGDRLRKIWNGIGENAIYGWQFGKSDPRKLIFAAKVGMALSIVSLLIFLKEPFMDISVYSIWAIFTVVVVFEFSIGATLSKGFNRGLGTVTAGGLALGFAELSTLAGKWEEGILIISIFVAGFAASFIKLFPKMKPYEYGFRVFLITFCFIMVSGYRTGTFIQTAITRFVLIVIGASVTLAVNICIYPIWAGEDLHNLVVKNFTGVAKSLEGCVEGYLKCVEYDRISSKILTYQASDDPVYSGYRSAVESTSQEDTLMGFAVWEPPHGPYKMLKYPWKSYVMVSGALRHCAFTVMALHGCLLAEIQAPPERRLVFSNEMQRVGSEGAKVLRELGRKVKAMERLGQEDILSEVHQAAEELQKKIDKRSYLLVNSECWEIAPQRNDVQETGIVESDQIENLHYLGIKSRSETVLDLRPLHLSKSWDPRLPSPIPSPNPNANLSANAKPHVGPNREVFQKQISWPSRNSFSFDGTEDTEEERTYESASALSLATFASLLIEFVARLQNLVDSFEELSEKARFKEPVETPEAHPGFWERLTGCFRSKR
ncbi:aluminum-activated malate transporter 9 [Amborella trichopoda]|uniref:Aluminum-activated malate transporter n=1 Tax=Amborella trichopoda TaxID=13333 RepID=W1NZA3_AMBTC|nr:aluminum-activated malate transporter 9 [Amborella trichopoda]ERN00993.1 hypothetical protein AMTR_s00002p00112740 [Amborella trichopoda]|eukprot:XP_006838424.1 aluminum-activated malate transporter 9 [Amborella trichopoda]